MRLTIPCADVSYSAGRYPASVKHASHARPLVVCALQFETAVLERSGLGAYCDLAVCGPGPLHVRRWAESIGETERPVILAGLAGGLRADRPAGSAWTIGEVIGEGGGRRRPSLIIKGLRPAVVVSTEAVVATVESKALLARRTGADLVDLESAAFAEAATGQGWTWGIVRGVSDGPDTTLPPGVERWVGSGGRTRGLFIVQSLLPRPWWWLGTLRLSRESRKAMQAVATTLDGAMAPSSSA
jgi:hypothetical protein